MDREKLEELKGKLEKLGHYDLPHLGAYNNRHYILGIINALLQDDKPEITAEVVMGKEGGLKVLSVGRWTPEEIKAIKESIIHWRDNVSRLKLANELGFSSISPGWDAWTTENTKIIIASFGSGVCALCLLCNDGYSNCPKCPLSRSGSYCRAEGSAWRKCKHAKGNKEIIEAAENMVRALEGLLE